MKTDRRKTYEDSGKRPGVPIGTRVEKDVIAEIDAARGGEMSRSAWLRTAIDEVLLKRRPARSLSPKRKG